MAPNTTLRSLRQAARLTQAALAERCRDLGAAMTQSRVSEFESGVRFPGHEQVVALAEVLRTKPERVFAILLSQKEAAA